MRGNCYAIISIPTRRDSTLHTMFRCPAPGAHSLNYFSSKELEKSLTSAEVEIDCQWQANKGIVLLIVAKKPEQQDHPAINEWIVPSSLYA